MICASTTVGLVMVAVALGSRCRWYLDPRGDATIDEGLLVASALQKARRLLARRGTDGSSDMADAASGRGQARGVA
jgi:hypothetical protein